MNGGWKFSLNSFLFISFLVLSFFTFDTYWIFHNIKMEGTQGNQLVHTIEFFKEKNEVLDILNTISKYNSQSKENIESYLDKLQKIVWNPKLFLISLLFSSLHTLSCHFCWMTLYQPLSRPLSIKSSYVQWIIVQLMFIPSSHYYNPQYKVMIENQANRRFPSETFNCKRRSCRFTSPFCPCYVIFAVISSFTSSFLMKLSCWSQFCPISNVLQTMKSIFHSFYINL